MSLQVGDIARRSNRNVTVQNGSTFSSQNSSNQMNIVIANETEFIKRGSLHFNGVLKMRTGSDVAPSPSEDLSYSNYAGVQSLIDTITIKGLKSNNTAETTQCYARYVSTRMSSLHGPQKLMAGLTNECLNSVSHDTCKILSEVDSSFSMELMSPILALSEQVTLEEFGGLRIEIRLVDGASFSFDQSGGALGTTYYTLSDCELSYVSLEPTNEWKAKRALEWVANNGIMQFQYPSVDCLPSQIQSQQDQVYSVVNYSALKSVYYGFMLSSEESNQEADSFQNSVIDVLSTSLSVNGRLDPLKYAVTGATNTNKSALCRNYVEAVTHSAKPDQDRVLNNLDPLTYSDSSNPVQNFAVGYLLNDDGVRMINSNLNMAIESDVSNPTNVYTFFDVIKTLTITPNSLSVSS